MVLRRKISKKFAYFMVSVIFFTGLLKVALYFFKIKQLERLTPTGVMNPVTAACFVIMGAWLFLYLLNLRVAKQTLPFVATLIVGASLLKLAQIMGYSSELLSHLLFHDSLNSSESFKSVAPNSALLLLLCGVTLFNAYRETGWQIVINDLCKIAGFLISYLAIIGYIYNFEVVYKVGAFMPMALNTAVGYIFFFTVSLIEMPPGTFMKVVGSGLVGGRMARRAIPLVLVLPMAFGYLRIMGEQALLFSPSYGTALQSAFMVLLVLIFVFLYARRLNIQDKKRLAAELQIAESERKYRTLVYALREGVVYYDTKGIISFCNRSFCELSGYSEDEIKGKSVFDFFVKEEQKEKYRALLENRDDIKSEIYEENVRTRHGDNIWVSISARPVCNDAGEMIAALSTIVDITERKKQMEDIEAFSASAAHDINAPLARIEMIAMLLIESTEGQLDEESLSLLQAIAGITSNMRSLLKDLLQFSKLGVTNIEKHEVDTGLLVKEVIEASRHINPKAKIKVNPIPTVFADKAMLKQVYTNLISNALKYSGNKEEPVVEIGSEQNNNNTVFYVKDNGAGFDMKEAEKLFAAFQRLHYEFEGNGLGLPIVKRIIEKHGGKIWASGAPMEGATFYFTLD